MRSADKNLAVIDGEIYYLTELYDLKGNFLMKIWERAASFDSMEEADEYLARDKSALHLEDPQ